MLMHTVNVDIFVQYICLRISCHAVDVLNFDVNEKN